MIITRTPFRITLGGGGTDLPSFYEQHGGFVFAMTINQYMYIMLTKRSVADRKIILRYSQVETVNSIDDIIHPTAREALRLHNLNENIELTSIATLPAKTGVGSSGSYLVGLLTAIRAYLNRPAMPGEIAEEACHIEMEILKEPVGKQDQYMAAFGGFCALHIDKAGHVEVEQVNLGGTTALELACKARLYYTGIQRSATSILKDQNNATKNISQSNHMMVVDALCKIKEIGYSIKRAFSEGDLDIFGRLMDEHWKFKKSMSERITITALDDLYGYVKKEFGVLGGKIVGAGGGGFIMLYCPQRGKELDEFMASHGMQRVDYIPSFQGSKVVNDMNFI